MACFGACRRDTPSPMGKETIPPAPSDVQDVALREALPGATVRSTFIVGYPGETDEHFHYLLTFLERAKLDRVGFFAYSQEEGTKAFDAAGQVPERVKKQRLLRAREVQRRISNDLCDRLHGEHLDVLVEGKRILTPSSPLRTSLGQRFASFGRSKREAPGVDGAVYVAGEYEEGEFVSATIVGHTDFDRVARPLVAAASR